MMTSHECKEIQLQLHDLDKNILALNIKIDRYAELEKRVRDLELKIAGEAFKGGFVGSGVWVAVGAVLFGVAKSAGWL